MNKPQDTKAVARARRQMTRLSERGARPRRIRRAVNRLIRRIEVAARQAERKQAAQPAATP